MNEIYLRLIIKQEQKQFYLLRYKCMAMEILTSIKENHKSLEEVVDERIDDIFVVVAKQLTVKGNDKLIELVGSLSIENEEFVFVCEKKSEICNLKKLSYDEEQRVMGNTFIQHHKYLEDIGLYLDNFPENWNPFDKRNLQWMKDRRTHGFDERDTWSFDFVLKRFLYERLVEYKQCASQHIVMDKTGHLFNYEGVEYSLEEVVDKMIEGLKLDLTLDEYSKKRKTKKVKKQIEDVFPILQLCLPSLWW